MPKGLADFRLLQRRVEVAERLLAPWKKMCHKRRRVVLGDYSAIEAEAPGQQSHELTDRGVAGRHDRETRDLADVLVTAIEDGASNDIQQNIRSLVQQTSYRVPEIEADVPDPTEAAMIGYYLGARLGPAPDGCNARDAKRLADAMLIIDGTGTTWTSMHDGKPSVQAIDSLDRFWEVGWTSPNDSAMQGFRLRQPLGYWIEFFNDEAPFRDILDTAYDDDSKRDVMLRDVELIFAWDNQGVGTQAIWRGDKAFEDRVEPIELIETPFWHDFNGFRQPFCPVDTMTLMVLPSGAMPLSYVDAMLPHQMLARALERSAMHTIRAGAATYLAEVDSFADESEFRKFLRGLWGQVLRLQKGGLGKVQRLEALEVSQSHMALLQRAESKLAVSGRVNPYSQGMRVDDVQFAREVAAIQESSGLDEATVRQEIGAQWGRIGQRFLWLSKYDFLPLTIDFDGAKMPFGPENPILPYLRVSAELMVGEDATGYVGRDTQIVRATQELNLAFSAAEVAPGWPRLAVQKLARAFGHRDMRKVFEGPAPVAGGAETTDATLAAAQPVSQ